MLFTKPLNIMILKSQSNIRGKSTSRPLNVISWEVAPNHQPEAIAIQPMKPIIPNSPKTILIMWIVLFFIL